MNTTTTYRRKPGPTAYAQWQQQQQAAQAPAPAPAPAPKPAAPKIKITGDAELWTTLQQITDTSNGWTKTTRAMTVPGGVLINTCSRKKGSDVAAEALVFVPRVRLRDGKIIE
jgi:hypothetical protein